MFANRALRPLQLHQVPRRRATIGRRVTSCKNIGRRRLVAYAGLALRSLQTPIQLSFQRITTWFLRTCMGAIGPEVEAIVSAVVSL
jgi:hypothetical protein